MFAGHDHAQFLSDQVRFAFAANARCIDEAIALGSAHDQRIDNVACRARFGRHNGTLGAGELIQQRGLADVRPADDGYLNFRGFGLAAFGVLPIPGPFDEFVLLIVGALLWLFYRDSLRDAWVQAARATT